MSELPKWNLHSLDGKNKVEFISHIATYTDPWVSIDGVKFYLTEFKMLKNDDDYTLNGLCLEYNSNEPVRIFVNYKKNYIILGK